MLMIGARLQKIEDVVFYRPGLQFVGYKLLEKRPNDIHMDMRPTPEGTAVELKLKIADDCPLGEHHFRIRTDDQLSEMVSFWVTPFPCVVESNVGQDGDKKSNGDIENA